MNSPFFTLEGLLFILRWLHVFFGVLWIGLLYYFNFVHGSFMKEAAAGAKPDVVGKLLPRALWWFRWGAFWTMTTGVILILAYGHQMQGYNNPWGVMLVVGGVMGLIMGSNVWFVIWPNQQVVMASAAQVAAGGQALPNAADAAAKAGLASRTNTLLSIPMLFLMLAGRHLLVPMSDAPNFTLYWIVALGILAVIELNALKGKLGPIETVTGVITSGFALTAVFVAWMHIAL